MYSKGHTNKLIQVLFVLLFNYFKTESKLNKLNTKKY
jgi:hypothetical protein